MKYGAYWCVVHNSEYHHHNLFHTPIFPPPPPLCSHPSIASISFNRHPSHQNIFFSPFWFPILLSFLPPFPKLSLATLLSWIYSSLSNILHPPSPLVPGQRRPTRPFQQLCRCMMSLWRLGPCGATTWRISLSKTVNSTWESQPLPAISMHAATKMRASPANTLPRW